MALLNEPGKGASAPSGKVPLNLRRILFDFILLAILLGVIGYAVWYFADLLYFKPERELAAEKAKGPPPVVVPVDPSLGEFQQSLEAEPRLPLDKARGMWTAFLQRNPDSTKLADARKRLGDLNSRYFLSAEMTPEKIAYNVRPGDGMARIENRNKTHSELIAYINKLDRDKLRAGEPLVLLPSGGSLVVSRRTNSVTLLYGGRFFREYPVVAFEGGAERPQAKAEARVFNISTWGSKGGPITWTDKEWRTAPRWVQLSPGNLTLFSQGSATANPPPPTPPGQRVALAPEHMVEIGVMLTRGSPVVVE